MRRPKQALAGQSVTFHGFNGQDYSAYVDHVRNGVAVILYPVFNRSVKGEMVTAYVSDADRLTVGVQAQQH